MYVYTRVTLSTNNHTPLNTVTFLLFPRVVNVRRQLSRTVTEGQDSFA